MPHTDSIFAAECINTGLIKHYEINTIFGINKILQNYFEEKK